MIEKNEEKEWEKNFLTHTQTHTIQNENREHPKPALHTGHTLRAWVGLVQ